VALIALAGIERSREPKNDPDPLSKRPPKISVLVAAKNEEKVIKRLLDVLIALDYPPDKKEILVVEDGSTDRTAEICQEYAKKHPRLVKFFHQEKSNGKPAAVNFIARKASGEVVGVFDADSVPEPDVLRKVASYFSDPQTVAVQGLIHPINARENLLTRAAAADQAFLNAVQRGKNRFSLFVQAIGPCFFIRKKALKRLKYWNENSLVEDIDLAVKLIREGKGVELAKDIGCWQECPPSLKCFVQQRLRWYRGILETAFEHSSSIIRFSRRAYDALMTLMSPIVNALALFGFLIFICSFFIPLPFGPLPFTLSYCCWLTLCLYFRHRLLFSAFGKGISN
jgi:cellulose synthase/poly-beta-1,6-N-acetylglucosamine synthase-like glycosyltransferase